MFFSKIIMELSLYNTLTRKKEKFVPLKKSYVGLYSCGPTVYWYQHIGNMRAYIFADTLKRVLSFNGFNVKHIINITDVGHLTSDADEGEDKMEKSAKKEGKTAKEIADFYFNEFEKDLEKLNIIMPDVWPKASEHIDEQIGLIEELEKKGYTYKTSEGIYFDTSKVEDYGKLAKLKVEDLRGGARVELGEKKNKTDFALWKFSEVPGKRQQEWDSPWGLGFPGWHIECSAMSSKYLGEKFDIHTGGEDHVPVHHTNEIAQSESALGKKPWVKYWLHVSFLTTKGEKISKSKGGLFTISELEEKGFNALDYRYFCLTGHYRKQLDFSLKNLKNAQNSYERLKNICLELEDDGEFNDKYFQDFRNSVNDDLDTVKGLQVLWKLVRDKKAKGKVETIRKFDEVLGLNLLEREEIEVPKEVRKMIEEREKARSEKNWDKADRLRDKIKEKGFILKDGKNGTEVEKFV
jgi:cysteinyl-tRNA synthetase